MSLFKLCAGICFCLLGLGYLLKPEIISRINAVIRNTILNDTYLALERKKWGFFFLLIGFFLVYLSLNSPAVK